MEDYIAFEVLGIAPTTDKRTIKKAYAALVKRYHPEEYPEEWAMIHAAYEEAIKLADKGIAEVDTQAGNGPAVTYVTNRLALGNLSETVEAADKEEQEEIAQAFENLNELVSDARIWQAEEKHKLLNLVLEEVERLGQQKKQNINDWQDFFAKKDYFEVFDQKAFYKKLGDVFAEKVIGIELRDFLLEQVHDLAQYYDKSDIHTPGIGLLTPVAYAEMKIKAAYFRRVEKKDTVAEGIKKALIAIGICALIGMWIWVIYDSVFMKHEAQTKRQIKKLEQDAGQMQVMQQSTQKSMEQAEAWLQSIDQESVQSAYEIQLVSAQAITAQEETVVQKIENGMCLREGIYLSDWFSDMSGQEEGFSFEEVTNIDTLGQLQGKTLSAENTYAFEITSDGEAKTLILGCDVNLLHMSDECRIYLYDGAAYEEVIEWKGHDVADKIPYWFQIGNYRVFVILVREEENAEKIIFVNPVKHF